MTKLTIIGLLMCVSSLAFSEKGTVKSYNADKGYGFITPDSGDDIFVHFADVNAAGYKTLDEGQKVEYEVTSDSKGTRATNLKLK